MARQEDLPRPTIVLGVNEHIVEAHLGPLLLGLEEQGVPVDMFVDAELNPLTLAHEASLRSVLGVGIGVSLNYAVVTTDKLPERRPYLAEWFRASPQADRTLGGNAARIVKRLPLVASPRIAADRSDS